MNLALVVPSFLREAMMNLPDEVTEILHRLQLRRQREYPEFSSGEAVSADSTKHWSEKDMIHQQKALDATQKS